MHIVTTCFKELIQSHRKWRIRQWQDSIVKDSTERHEETCIYHSQRESNTRTAEDCAWFRLALWGQLPHETCFWRLNCLKRLLNPRRKLFGHPCNWIAGEDGWQRLRIIEMLVVKPTGRGCCLLSVYLQLSPIWRNNCLNDRIGVFFLFVRILKMTQMSSKCLLPLYNFINYPSEFPGACVRTIGRMQMLNYPSHSIPVRYL